MLRYIVAPRSWRQPSREPRLAAVGDPARRADRRVDARRPRRGDSRHGRGTGERRPDPATDTRLRFAAPRRSRRDHRDLGVAIALSQFTALDKLGRSAARLERDRRRRHRLRRPPDARQRDRRDHARDHPADARRRPRDLRGRDRHRRGRAADLHVAAHRRRRAHRDPQRAARRRASCATTRSARRPSALEVSVWLAAATPTPTRAIAALAGEPAPRAARRIAEVTPRGVRIALGARRPGAPARDGPRAEAELLRARRLRVTRRTTDRSGETAVARLDSTLRPIGRALRSRAANVRRRVASAAAARGRPLGSSSSVIVVLLAVRARRGCGAVGCVLSVADSAPPLADAQAAHAGRGLGRLRRRRRRASASSSPTILRTPIAAQQIPKVLRDATVAIEDQRFYEHKGVDYEGVVRAAVKNVRAHKTVQGGSTLTMQLVRNLYTGDTTRKRRRLQAQDPRGQARRGARDSTRATPASSGSSTSTSTTSRTAPSAARRRSASRPRPRVLLRQARARSSRCAEAAMLAGLPQAPSTTTRFVNPDGAPRRAATRCWADGRAQGMITPGERADRRMATRARAERANALLLQAPRALLLRLRQDQLIKRVRRDDRAPGRAARSTRRSTCKLQTAARATRSPDTSPAHATPSSAIVDDRPARTATSSRWRRRGTYGTVEVQPRRPGPPPAGLDVQGHGADDRAARRASNPNDDLLRLEAAEVHRRRRPARRSTSRPTATATRGTMNLVQGDAELRQHGLPAARPRPRARRR